MADATLTYQTRYDHDRRHPGPVPVTALVLIWSQDEPERVGELLVIPPGDPGPSVVYGREAPGQAAEEGRVRLTLQRPGRTEPMALSGSPRISRRQLTLHARGDGALEVEALGRLPLLHNGTAVARALVRPGDLLELKEQQVFLCLTRMSALPPLPGALAPPAPGGHPFGMADAHGLVGESPACWELRKALAFTAQASAHVLIQGASGSGKELVARGLHALSSRGARPLVSRNAATFPEGLIDAELFGNAKGFPNPGMSERPGLIGQADGSTLFLDEFGELPQEMQAHLLRVMDEGEYQRLGEAELRRSNFRLLAATNRPLFDLKHDVAARLKLRIHVPDLNERREDIPLIARHLIGRLYAADPGLVAPFLAATDPVTPRFSPGLMSGLVRHMYTTHVRELESFLWTSLAGSPGDYLALTPELEAALTPDAKDDTGEGAEVDPAALPMDVIVESLTRHRGVQAKVWKELGLNNRFVLRRLLIKYDINAQDYEES